jgi:hypothetical protein
VGGCGPGGPRLRERRRIFGSLTFRPGYRLRLIIDAHRVVAAVRDQLLAEPGGRIDDRWRSSAIRPRSAWSGPVSGYRVGSDAGPLPPRTFIRMVAARLRARVAGYAQVAGDFQLENRSLFRERLAASPHGVVATIARRYGSTGLHALPSVAQPRTRSITPGNSRTGPNENAQGLDERPSRRNSPKTRHLTLAPLECGGSLGPTRCRGDHEPDRIRRPAPAALDCTARHRGGGLSRFSAAARARGIGGHHGSCGCVRDAP